MYQLHDNTYMDYYKFAVDNTTFTIGEDKLQPTIELMNNFENLYNSLKIPNLSKYGFTKNEMDEFVQGSTKALSGSFSGNPVDFSEDAVKYIYEKLPCQLQTTSKVQALIYLLEIEKSRVSLSTSYLCPPKLQYFFSKLFFQLYKIFAY